MNKISKLKEKLLIEPEENGDRLFADYLGISYEELKEITYHEEKVFVEMPGGGENLSHFLITFEENKDKILNKIINHGHLNPTKVNAEFYISIYDPLPDEVWEFLFEDIEQYNDFISELNSLESLLEKSTSWRLSEIENQILLRQVYIGTFAALETCLQDTFIYLIENNENYKNDFIRNHPELAQRKIPLSEYNDFKLKVDKIVEDIIKSTIFHNFKVVKNMYQDSIGIDFPPIQKLYKYLPLRHDLVHRNGKTKTGVKQDLELTQVLELLLDVRKFITRLLIKTNMFNENSLIEITKE